MAGKLESEVLLGSRINLIGNARHPLRAHRGVTAGEIGICTLTLLTTAFPADCKLLKTVALADRSKNYPSQG